MPLKVEKQENEINQSLVRRFVRGIKQSGILVQARKVQFHKRKKSHQMKKKAALKREELRKKYEKSKKMGTL